MTDNAYMQERAADVLDVSKSIMSLILCMKLRDTEDIEFEVVLVE